MRLQHELAAAIERAPDPQPVFELRIGWGSDYNAVFRGTFAEETAVDVLAARALSHGRVLLHAPGGGGKTVILTRLLRQSIGANRAAFYVDLRRWTPADYDDWKATANSERVTFLLKRFGLPGAEQVTLESLEPGVEKLVLVDGLNEVVPRTAQEILESLNDLARSVPSSGVIVTDRLVRRDLGPAWQLSAIMPIRADQVRAYLRLHAGGADALQGVDNSFLALLDAPYFLDAALRGDGAASSVEVHHRYFSHHAGLTEEELRLAATAAFRAYEQTRSRTFPSAAFERDVGQAVVEKLRQAQGLIIAGDHAYFAHHLKHDYLAAVYLSEHRETWNNEVFNIVTFWAASFDCLEMTLQLLTSIVDGDRFIRSVYDWNQYAAAYALAQGRHRGRIPVSPQMELALLAMLAERRWDLITATVEKVTDALQLFGTPEALALLAADSLEEVQDFVRGRDLGAALSAWSTIFCRPRDDDVSDRELEQLLGGDSLVAWTLSNVLKRLHLTEAQQERLRKMLGQAEQVARWRIVHTLGAFPNKLNARALLEVLDHDAYRWAQYGAIRSLVEMAARGENVRTFVFAALAERMPSIALDDRVLPEFERAVFIDAARAPSDWGELVIDLFRALRDTASSIEVRDRWERLAYRVREKYSAVRA